MQRNTEEHRVTQSRTEDAGIMLTGKVIRFDEVRGYGFIAPDGGGEDVFAFERRWNRGGLHRGRYGKPG